MWNFGNTSMLFTNAHDIADLALMFEIELKHSAARCATQCINLILCCTFLCCSTMLRGNCSLLFTWYSQVRQELADVRYAKLQLYEVCELYSPSLHCQMLH
jgi:hypothetical protein